jgi:hypothetical protein
LRQACWLVVLCLVAIPAAAQSLGVDSTGDERVAIRAVSSAPETALPPAVPAAANPAVDDLSGTAAASPFRLAQPTPRRAGSTRATPLSLRSRVLTIVGERGPPFPTR